MVVGLEDMAKAQDVGSTRCCHHKIWVAPDVMSAICGYYLIVLHLMLHMCVIVCVYLFLQ